MRIKMKSISGSALRIAFMLGMILMTMIAFTKRVEADEVFLRVGQTPIAQGTTQASGPNWTYTNTDDGHNPTLYLNGVNITAEGIGIKYNGDYELQIVLSSENTITSKYEGIFSSYAGITISGNGSLEITSDKVTGIYVNSHNITINSGTITATGYGGGINCYDGNITINGGTVTAEGTGYLSRGIYTDARLNDYAIIIKKGTVTATGVDYGLGDENDKIVIEGGSVTAVGSKKGIGGNVINTISGTGWTNTAGTEGKEDIAVSTEGRALDDKYKKVQFPKELVPAKVTTAPTAKTGLTENGSAQDLVTAGKADGGEMAYALGTDATTAPAIGWSGSIPTGTDAGTYYVWYKAVGDKNHNDSQAECLKVTINEALKPVLKSISNATVTGVYNKTYTRAAITQNPKVTVDGKTLTEGVDYSLSYANNVDVGTATMTITGTGEYTDTKDVTFKILNAKQAKDMSNATVEGISDKSFTGKAITQNFTVNLGGRNLKAKKEYTVTYKNNKKVGTAAVTITGKGKIKGKITKTFKIKKADNPLKVKAVTKPATLKAKDLKKKSRTIAVTKVIKITRKGKGKVTYAKVSGDERFKMNKSGKITVKKGTPAGTYPITANVTAAGDGNYNKVSKPVTFTVKVS